jgi:hypothetical protein
MAKLQLAKKEDGTILILHEVWPKYVARLSVYKRLQIEKPPLLGGFFLFP